MLMIATLAVFPLLLVFRSSARPADTEHLAIAD
jgi:hypothetical protein